jgi:hypothetical protein
VGGDAFFQAAIVQASNDMSIGERCSLFYYLHRFLLTWHPECLLSKNDQRSQVGTSDDASQGLSAGLICHDFPNHLFGGENSLACRKVKSLFGYQDHESPEVK